MSTQNINLEESLGLTLAYLCFPFKFVPIFHHPPSFYFPHYKAIKHLLLIMQEQYTIYFKKLC